jgi:lysozyme
MADVPKVIDLSRWQQGIKLDQWAAAGGKAIICKASEATGIKDGSFDGFRAQAKSLGLGFASYHFMRPGKMSDQALWYLSCANPEQGERMCADWEVDGISPADLVAFLQAIWAKRPDVELTVYSGHIAKDQLKSKNDWLAQNTSLWVAQYTSASAPSWPTSTWPTWSLWQYSETGTIPGFANNVDANRFNGDDTALMKWFGPSVGTPAPAEPTPEPQPPVAVSPPNVSITVASDQPINLTINGVAVTLPQQVSS